MSIFGGISRLIMMRGLTRDTTLPSPGILGALDEGPNLKTLTRRNLDFVVGKITDEPLPRDVERKLPKKSIQSISVPALEIPDEHKSVLVAALAIQKTGLAVRVIEKQMHDAAHEIETRRAIKKTIAGLSLTALVDGAVRVFSPETSHFVTTFMLPVVGVASSVAFSYFSNPAHNPFSSATRQRHAFDAKYSYANDALGDAKVFGLAERRIHGIKKVARGALIVSH